MNIYDIEGKKKTIITIDTDLSETSTNPIQNAAVAKEFSQLSDTVNDKVTNPTSGAVGQILEIETVDEKGKPKTYKAVNKPTSSGTGTETVVSSVEPMDDDIPKVFIDGVIPTTKDDVLATMKYVSKTDEFFAYIKIKCQGTSSMSYPKKNFTVKLYSDEARETKIKKLFKDWKIEECKFVLKANYIDHSHARNIVSAKLWNEVVSSRSDYDTLPEELKTSPRHGAVDGFPIKVYTNGTYQGVYTWNIGKDAWMWNMDEDNANHVLLCAEGNTDGVYAETTSNFRALWNGVDGSKPGWSIEVGTNSTAVKDSLNALISCVKDTDDETFKSTIGTYLDVNSAIDYYIHQYVICGLDGLAHNMLLGTYDLVKWRCGAYDMDATFGLWWNGTSFVSTNYACPEDYQEQFSLLWERIETVFLSELKKRYAELRKTVYSLPNMVTHFERFMDLIGADLYAEDLTIYTGIPSGSTNNIKQIRNYIRDRLAYCDAEFGAMVKPVPATGITLDQTILSFTDTTPITLTATLEPSDSTDVVTWESNDSSVATVLNGVVTPLKNGTCTIIVKAGNVSATCGVSISAIPEPVPATGITLDKATLSFTNLTPVTLVATITPENASDSVVWTSSDETVAKVEDGVVTPIWNGECTITAQAGSVSTSCSISVTGLTGLYPLENGTATFSNGNTLSVTNGNHVNYVVGGTWKQTFSSLSDISRHNGGDEANPGNKTYVSERFKLSAGDVVTLKKANTKVVVTGAEDQTSVGSSFFLVTDLGDTANIIAVDIFEDGEGNITIQNDCSVDGLFMWANSIQYKNIDFDIEMHVNGTRYI